jgi:hypothetical protein
MPRETSVKVPSKKCSNILNFFCQKNSIKYITGFTVKRLIIQLFYFKGFYIVKTTEMLSLYTRCKFHFHGGMKLPNSFYTIKTSEEKICNSVCTVHVADHYTSFNRKITRCREVCGNYTLQGSQG